MEQDQLIKTIDFWQKTVTGERLFGRAIIEKIDYESREVIDLLGVRRCGKSSVLKLIIDRNKILDRSLYINFEDPVFIENNQSRIIEDLIETFKEHFNPNLKYLFFDEIQNINQWEKSIRKLREAGTYKIYITGSSSKLLSGELSTLLTGRHLSYKIFPLSFSEFLGFEKIPFKTKKDRTLSEAKIKRAFGEYLEIGGFPEIVKTKNVALLKTYFYDILEKDIVTRYDVRDKATLEKMAVFILSNAGKFASIESLKKTFDVSYQTAVNYLEYFKEAFLIFDLPQFSYSLKTQQKSFKKIYAVDPGLAGAVSFRFSQDKGRVLENIVMAELAQKEGDIYYYKTKNDLEVDFLIKNKEIKMIQVCQSLTDGKTRKRELGALLTAMAEMKLEKGLILTENEEDEIVEGDTIVRVMPVWKWLLSPDK